jgi:hypothetical protein
MSTSSLTAPRAAGRRSGAVYGAAFIVVLFLSAAVVSLPQPDASGQQVVDYYTQYRGLVVVTQLLGLCTVPLLALFAIRLRALDRPSGTAALIVAAMGSLPTLATLLLAVTADPAHIGAAHALNVIAGLADDVLFLTISGFAAVIAARRGTYRPWLRAIAVGTSAVCLARGVLGFAHMQSWLDAAAPLAFLGLVAALSIRLLRD